ncbi:hypothetical protein TWF703_002807 [Orbilia oligospora]|uniref:Uncharacterized protein n=1 Tax=Orbilia oligospora TaxID=2813651 RepID=A0A7C8NV86_ORBOL|nr:hypothetical protein TWF703_002807 [Orbilia oligospora]
MENPAAQQPFLRLVEANIVLMCRPDTYTAAVNHLQNHCSHHNKEVLDKLDLESGSNKQYQDQISLWRARLARESTGTSAEIVFPNQYFGSFNDRATGLCNGTINFIHGPLDPTLPRAKRTSYWEGLRAKHNDIHGICLVMPFSDEARHFNARKENERAYLTTPEKLELMKDISQRYQRTFEFNIKTESHIRYFDLDPPEVIGKWDPIHPPTVDPINPKRFIGKLTDTEALPFIKSRLLRGTDIQGSDWFTLRLFGYRHEIHAKEVRIIENEIQQIQKNLQNMKSLLESLREQQRNLYKSNETQKEMLSICRKDIQRLDHTDQLDWDFGKVRQHLAESSIREISSEYGLKSCIPKEISPVDLQIPKIKAMGVDIFKILSGKSGEQLIHILETFVPRLKSYEDSIQQSFGATISTGLMKIKLGVPTIFEQENIWAEDEDEDEDDEWSETRSQLRSKSEEYLSPGSDAFSKSTEAATKNLEEDYINLLRKAVGVKKTLKDKWNTSLELSETFRASFFEGVTKFHEGMETLRSKEIRELFLLDTKAFQDGESVHESDFLDIGTYANLLHHAPTLQAISDFL